MSKSKGQTKVTLWCTDVEENREYPLEMANKLIKHRTFELPKDSEFEITEEYGITRKGNKGKARTAIEEAGDSDSTQS